MFNTKIISILLATSICATGCNENEVIIEDPVELITTLTFTLTQQGGGNTVVFSFQDLDGEGGAEPIISEGTLLANSSYTGTLELLNESENPAINISQEIESEKEDHQFFYETSGVDLTIEYDDADANQYPVGVNTIISTGSAGTGALTITLRHEPDKTASGVSEGDMTNAGGETDIEVTFDITIQ